MANPVIETLNRLIEQSKGIILPSGQMTYTMSDENLPPKALALAVKHCIAQLRKVAP